MISDSPSSSKDTHQPHRAETKRENENENTNFFCDKDGFCFSSLFFFSGADQHGDLECRVERRTLSSAPDFVFVFDDFVGGGGTCLTEVEGCECRPGLADRTTFSHVSMWFHPLLDPEPSHWRFPDNVSYMREWRHAAVIMTMRAARCDRSRFTTRAGGQKELSKAIVIGIVSRVQQDKKKMKRIGVEVAIHSWYLFIYFLSIFAVDVDGFYGCSR